MTELEILTNQSLIHPMVFKVNLYDTVHLNIDTQRHTDPLFMYLITHTYIILF